MLDQKSSTQALAKPAMPRGASRENPHLWGGPREAEADAVEAVARGAEPLLFGVGVGAGIHEPTPFGKARP